MLWFGLSKKEREKRMNMISAIKPTSKASLKLQCILVSKGDVEEANKLYDFFAKDMKELPDYDPQQPSVMENVKVNALGIFNFVKENKDDIVQGIDFIRSMLSKNGAIPPVETPQALPAINE